jgi:dihydroorotate dehydrogenase electron transfer subunit
MSSLSLDKLLFNNKEVLLSNGAGILNWLGYADLGFNEFVTKSIGLNGPEELYEAVRYKIEKRLAKKKVKLSYVEERKIIDKAYNSYKESHPKEWENYWNGLKKRSGWNPPVMVHGKLDNKEYFVNRMGLPNPGVNELIKRLQKYEGNTPIIVSVFGQNDKELERIINLFESNDEISKKIKGYEINKSCPNTDKCESVMDKEKESLLDSIKTLRRKTNKKLYLKLSPLVDVSNFIVDFEKAGIDALTLSNTIPTQVYNKYSGKKIIEGGLSGELLFEHTLYTLYKARQTGSKLRINLSGGLNTLFQAYSAVITGADTLQFGSVFAGKSKKNIINYISSLRLNLNSMLSKPIDDKFNIIPKEPFWFNEVLEKGKLRLENDEHKQYIIKKVIQESKDTYTLYFNKKIKHNPGQYLAVMLWDENDNPMMRPYTLSGNNSITVRIRGETSKRLAVLNKGDKIYMGEPRGNGYNLDLLKNKKVLVIGGGCGIASLTDLVENVNADFDFKVGYKSNDEILTNMRKRIRKNVKNYTELIADKLPVAEINFSKYDYVVTCGPEAMMQAIANEAAKQGIDEANIIKNIERYMKCMGLGLCASCDTGDNKEDDRVCIKGTVFTQKESNNFGERDKSGAIIKEKSEKLC